mgnify:CR=1 FL=1
MVAVDNFVGSCCTVVAAGDIADTADHCQWYLKKQLQEVD